LAIANSFWSVFSFLSVNLALQNAKEMPGLRPHDIVRIWSTATTNPKSLLLEFEKDFGGEFMTKGAISIEKRVADDVQFGQYTTVNVQRVADLEEVGLCLFLLLLLFLGHFGCGRVDLQGAVREQVGYVAVSQLHAQKVSIFVP
jgi:hypothetical protein